jgi:hypothetical protein
VVLFFAFASDLRKILYTTNAIESLNAQVCKAVRVRGHFPSEEAATKLIWLVLRNVQARWKNPPISWHAAKTQMAIQFEDRFIPTDYPITTGSNTKFLTDPRRLAPAGKYKFPSRSTQASARTTADRSYGIFSTAWQSA